MQVFISSSQRLLVGQLIQRGKYSVIQLSGDNHGLYVSGVRNDFGTPLVCRGPLSDVCDFIGRLP